MTKWISVFLFGWLVSISSAFALQIKPVNDNDTVSAVVAQAGKTRVFVKGDRIVSLHGTPNAYVYRNDNMHGQVFLLPTVSYQHKPFSVFVTTEAGKTYGLRLTPKDILSASIELQPTHKHHNAALWELASRYSHTVIALIRYMVNGIAPNGYAVVNIVQRATKHQKQRVDYYLGKIAALTLIARYDGAHLQGEIYRVHNQLNHTIRLTESEFYRPGTRAVALAQHTLAAHGDTRLYGVVSHD